MAYSIVRSEPCPSDWYFYGPENVCLHLVDKNAKFHIAKKTCWNNFTAGLLYIDSAKKENFIKTNIIVNKHTFYWLGLKDLVGDDKLESHRWLASNKTLAESNYINLANNRPPRIDAYKCIIIYFRRTPEWREERCGSKNKFICEKGLETKLINLHLNTNEEQMPS
ncbi:uncharacterized protein TRIADDRAFT_61849 [Trichoplax adhaerens]|uniref:C-type lectin domain-containing protein n=1 Tax=Trichoplax adhaerens TaxID=10228 RepID=B3SC59_TRIAD|nr:predicted protein [Trichoplax adhaerens]EDV19662.1 predicted protein [Trichoplax adhaerens]|eukprot:XP_002117819.1 predicted protein [Trichoplax adhaerens]